MSLIQEALKRQHEDLGTGKPPPAGAGADKAAGLKLKGDGGAGHAEDHAPATPPALPLTPLPPEPQASHSPAAPDVHVVAQLPKIPVAAKRSSKKPLLIVGIIVFIALLGVGAWLLIGAFTSAPPPPPPEPAPKPKPVVQPPVTSAVPVAPVNPVPATQQVVQVPVVPVTNTPVQNVVTQFIIPVVTSKPPEEVPVKVEPVVWPLLKVNMILKMGNTCAVKINSAELSVGDEIEGVKVVTIEADSITLKYKGETRKVRAGGTTR